jgi:hypothetical protein
LHHTFSRCPSDERQLVTYFYQGQQFLYTLVKDLATH